MATPEVACYLSPEFEFLEALLQSRRLIEGLSDTDWSRLAKPGGYMSAMSRLWPANINAQYSVAAPESVANKITTRQRRKT